MTARRKVPEVLAKAADLLEKKGWIQHNLAKYGSGAVNAERTHYCAAGAIWEVLGWPEGLTTKQGNRKLLPYVTRLGFRSTMDLARWNDMPSRKKSTVINLLRRGAKTKLRDRV